VANIQSAKKRIKQTAKSRLRNSSLRSKTVTFLKKARQSIESSQKDSNLLETAKETVKLAISHIDRMVPKGIFHKNKAARLKSRLNAKLKKVVLGA
jgi:small subunit ribosomal protein S20